MKNVLGRNVFDANGGAVFRIDVALRRSNDQESATFHLTPDDLLKICQTRGYEGTNPERGFDFLNDTINEPHLMEVIMAADFEYRKELKPDKPFPDVLRKYYEGDAVNPLEPVWLSYDKVKNYNGLLKYPLLILDPTKDFIWEDVCKELKVEQRMVFRIYPYPMYNKLNEDRYEKDHVVRKYVVKVAGENTVMFGFSGGDMQMNDNLLFAEDFDKIKKQVIEGVGQLAV